MLVKQRQMAIAIRVVSDRGFSVANNLHAWGLLGSIPRGWGKVQTANYRPIPIWSNSPQPCWSNPKGESPDNVPVKCCSTMNGLPMLDSWGQQHQCGGRVYKYSPYLIPCILRIIMKSALQPRPIQLGVAQLVELALWKREAAGSSPVTQTNSRY